MYFLSQNQPTKMQIRIINVIKYNLAKSAIFFPRFILYNFFLFWLIYGGLGLGLILGFWGWGFQLMGFGACGVGPSFFWVGALYINIKE